MRLFKPEYVVPGQSTRHRCSKWYVQFSLRGKTFRRSLHTANKRVAWQLAADLHRSEERRSAGLLDPAEEHAGRAIAEHLDDFESMLRSRGVSEAHRRCRMRLLGEFVKHGDVRWLRDLDEPRATACVKARAIRSTRSSAKQVHPARAVT